MNQGKKVIGNFVQNVMFIYENEENQNQEMNQNNQFDNYNNNINNNSSNNQNQNNIVTPNFNNSKQNIIFPKNKSISFNPNYNNRSNNSNNSNNINMGQSQKSNTSKKRGVFSSCPYQEELSQFVDFLGLLMEIESKIEDMKIDLAQFPDFRF